MFIVDPDEIIRLNLLYPQELGRDINEIIRIVKALKISDQQNVEIPANCLLLRDYSLKIQEILRR